jgi:hypothetical protein
MVGCDLPEASSPITSALCKNWLAGESISLHSRSNFHQTMPGIAINCLTEAMVTPLLQPMIVVPRALPLGMPIAAATSG